MFTWSQLGLHRKPVALLDVAGYYAGLIDFFDHAVARGLPAAESRAMLLVASEPAELLDALAAWRAPDVPQVLEAGET